MSDDFGAVFPPLPDWGDNNPFEDDDDFFNDSAYFNLPDFDNVVFNEPIFDDADRIISETYADEFTTFETVEDALSGEGRTRNLDPDDPLNYDDTDVDFNENPDEDDPDYADAIEKTRAGKDKDFVDYDVRGPYPTLRDAVNYLLDWDGQRFVENYIWYDGAYWVLLRDSP